LVCHTLIGHAIITAVKS